MTEFDLELEDIYNKIVYYPNKIYEIFCDFFGEEHVDLQNIYDKDSLCSTIIYYCNNDIEKLKNNKSFYIDDYKHLYSYPYILVWFPKLKITNEYNESVEVEDFWAKIEITYTGKMYYHFKLNRSTYFKSHIISDYTHSHVNGIDNNFNFVGCCLGQGPIKNTCNSLQLDYDESLWQLFCFELSKYVQTESVAGVPYRRMSTIRKGEYKRKINYFTYVRDYEFCYPEDIKNLLIAFTKDLLKKKLLKFNYFNNSYGLGMSFLEYMLTVSNYFIEWYNENKINKNIDIPTEDLYIRSILDKVHIKDNAIFTIKNINSHIYDKAGTKILTFKGKDIVLKIVEDINNDDNYTTILNIDIATAILNSVLKTLNYYYE